MTDVESAEADPLGGIADVERAEADPPADTPGGIDLRFRPDIEGLRAVAVLLVVLYHCGVKKMAGGFVGVDVFFVISGFLITGLLIREREKRNATSLPGFYARRARRILPAGMLVIVATVLAAYHYQNFIDFTRTAIDGRWAALFAANIHFANIGTDYAQQSNAPSPLLHYWSLGVEEQFYFVWPAIVIGVAAITRRWPLRPSIFVAAMAASIVSFVWALHAVSVNATWAYFSPFTRAWELGIGAAAAAVIGYASRIPKYVGLALAWLGLAAVIWSGVELTNPYVFPGKIALVPVLGTVAIIVGGASGIGARHALGLPPVRAVGRVSYGWYLLHYPPMIILVGSYWTGPLSVDKRLVIAAVTLVVAFAMYYVLEKPIRVSRGLAARPWASIGMGLACVAVAFLVSLLLHKGLPV